MAFTALERLFSTDRLPQRAARGAGHSTPALQERPASMDEGPFLATNMRSTFIPTRLSAVGTVRFGFSLIPLGEDDRLLLPLHQSILAQTQGSRCTSLVGAMDRLRANSYEPKTLVLPESWLPEICGADFDVSSAKTLMGTQGYVTKVEEMQVLVADLPADKAFVASAPALVGVYTRISDYLGVLVFRADRTIVAVTRDLVR